MNNEDYKFILLGKNESFPYVNGIAPITSVNNIDVAKRFSKDEILRFIILNDNISRFKIIQAKTTYSMVQLDINFTAQN